MKILLTLLLLSSLSQAKTLLRCKLNSDNSPVVSAGVSQNHQGQFYSWIKNYLGDTYVMKVDPLEWYQRDVTLHPFESEDRHTFRLQEVDKKRWVLKEISISQEIRFLELTCKESEPGS